MSERVRACYLSGNRLSLTTPFRLRSFVACEVLDIYRGAFLVIHRRPHLADCSR